MSWWIENYGDDSDSEDEKLDSQSNLIMALLWCDYDEENSLYNLSGDGEGNEENPITLKQFDDDDDDDDDDDEENSLCNLPESNPSVSSWDPTRLNYARLHKKCCQHLHFVFKIIYFLEFFEAMLQCHLW